VNRAIFSGDIRVARMSHTTNGAEELSVFDLTTDNLYAGSGYPSRPPESVDYARNIQLGFEVVKVLKFEGQYKKNAENSDPLYWRGEYYTTSSPTSTPADFYITNVSYTNPPADGNNFLTFNYGGPDNDGVINNSDIPNNVGSGYKGALIYYVEFRAVDANVGQDHMSSETYNIHYIIHK
jgi:hypothetical protein